MKRCRNRCRCIDGGRRFMRCLCTTRIRERWRRIRTRCGAGWRGQICLRWCMSSSSTTRRITRTTFCRRRRFWSTPTSRARTDTTLCSCRTRRLSRPARRGQTCGCSANWRSTWDSRRHCFRDTRRAADSSGAGGRARWPLEECGDGAHHASRICESRGIFRWRFIAILRARLLCRSRRDRCRRRRARSSFTRRRWPRKGRIRCPAFSLRSNRAGARARSAFRWSSWAGKPTTT